MRNFVLAMIVFVGCTGEPVPIGSNQDPVTCSNGKKNDLETDVDCGGICMACAPGQGCAVDGDCQSHTCVDKVCCHPGFLDCDKNVHNGCETDATTDANNCGACGVVCQHGEACVAGACKAQNNNCGGGCALAHATSQCVNNACVITHCDAGWADCDKNGANGCEVDATSDDHNCGGCGSVCINGQTCQHGACAGGPTCNDAIKNGHETDVDCGGGTCPVCADGKLCAANTDCHSGSCQKGVCQPANNCNCNPANGVGQCVNGACMLVSCNHGFGDCNADAKDGCEVNLASDGNNCGACGVTCHGKPCQNGACL